MKDFISIGQIVNTHGIKGEVKVYPLTDDTKRFKKLKKVYIDGEERNILSCKLKPTTVVLKIEGIDSIEEGNKYRNKYLEVERENAVNLPEGRYFVIDIIGCSVEDTNGENIGKVYDVMETGSNDVYVVKGEKEILIPAIEYVVTNIDIENKLITIKPLEMWQ